MELIVEIKKVKKIRSRFLRTFISVSSRFVSGLVGLAHDLVDLVAVHGSVRGLVDDPGHGRGAMEFVVFYKNRLVHINLPSTQIAALENEDYVKFQVLVG